MPRSRKGKPGYPTRKEKTARHEAEDAQPALIPMSEAEVFEAGKKLAQKVRELEEMEVEHDKERKGFREEETALKEEIAAIASTIRSQGR